MPISPPSSMHILPLLLPILTPPLLPIPTPPLLLIPPPPSLPVPLSPILTPALPVSVPSSSPVPRLVKTVPSPPSLSLSRTPSSVSSVSSLSSRLYEDYDIIYSPHVSSRPDISTEPSLLSTSVSTSTLYMIVMFFLCSLLIEILTWVVQHVALGRCHYRRPLH